MRSFEIWTDGACSGAPGAGGWAAILLYGETLMAISGSEPSTTNNRMELTAVIEGLRAMGQNSCTALIVTDSSYVKNGFTQWLPKWLANGWKSYRGDVVANQDLWQQLIGLNAIHSLRWKHVRGHGSSALNNAADRLAVRAKLEGRGVTILDTNTEGVVNSLA